MNEERPSARDFKLRMIGAGLFVALSPIYAIFSHYDREDRGFLVVSILVVFCAVAYVRRQHLRSLAFSGVLVALCAVQIAIAMVATIPARYPGFAVVPIAFLDLFIVLGLMSLVERQIGKSQ